MTAPANLRSSWTDGQMEALRRDYAADGAPAVARRVGRTTRAVYHKARSMGLAHQHRTATDDAFRGRLRALHAAGLSDTQVAGELGCERHTASRHRRAMGLPCNRTHEAQRRRVAGKTAEQCRRVGVRSLAEVRAVAFRAYAASSGWPADLTPREIHVLEALDAHGPMTRREIAGSVGLPWIGSRRSLKSRTPGGSYLASLMARGLVVDLGRVVRAGGKGKNSHLYSLSLTAERSPDHG